ncbi:MAG: SMI1/KNR4 family protein [Pirellulales bacterium]
MSLERIRAVLQIASDSNVPWHFSGPKTEALIEKAEAALGLAFPRSYREFVLGYGAGHVGGAEFYGVVNEDFVHSSVPNGIWVTLNERREANLPQSFLIVGSNGLGGWLVLDCSRVGDTDEAPVVEWWIGDQEVALVSQSFGDYFCSEVADAIERWRRH